MVGGTIQWGGGGRLGRRGLHVQKPNWTPVSPVGMWDLGQIA